MAQKESFSWDLMLKTVEKDVKIKEDMLLVVIHWMLIKRGFGCVGVGAEKSSEESEVPREVLPTDWNKEENITLQYCYKDTFYLLHRLKLDKNVIFNLVNVSDLSTSNVTIKVDSVVNMNGALENIISDHGEVLHRIKSQLIEPVTQKATKETQTQTDRSRSPDPRTSSDPSIPPHRDIDRLIDPLRVDPRPLEVGRSDLDPFGGGGGMLYDPFHRPHGSRPSFNPGFGIIGGLPRGSVPPGARFDPFGPSVPGSMNPRRLPPDADHLPPPGYDDMFM